MKRRLIFGTILILLAGRLLPGALGAPTLAAAECSDGEFQMRLPRGLEPLDGEEMAGYEAAVLSDYPGAAQTLLAAASADRSAALLVAAIDSDAGCLEAAREAAGALLGYPDAARELRFGANRCAGFGCAIGAQAYRLYFFSGGAQLILIAATGLEAEDVEAMLAGLRI